MPTLMRKAIVETELVRSAQHAISITRRMETGTDEVYLYENEMRVVAAHMAWQDLEVLAKIVLDEMEHRENVRDQA